MTDHLKLENVRVDLAGENIVRQISFHLESGQIGSLLGPSGCGKTTLLRTIAGFERPVGGSIHIRDRLVSDKDLVVPPEQRHIGMVFQDLALFPHLDIRGNVEFGIRHLSASERVSRVDELLALVDLSGYRNNYPHELSGGQQQRVALIRAMAPRPEVLLLDEPFSGQDTELREQLARQVSKILKQDGITALLVTHDQYEAFAFADVVGVINQGELHQWDHPFNLYHKPADRFVADFIGLGVFVPARVIGDSNIETEFGVIYGEMTETLPAGSEIDALVRPDDIQHDDLSPKMATIIAKSFRGADHLYTLELPGETQVLCLAPSHHNHHIGEKIGITLELDHLVVFPRKHNPDTTGE